MNTIVLAWIPYRFAMVLLLFCSNFAMGSLWLAIVLLWLAMVLLWVCYGFGIIIGIVLL